MGADSSIEWCDHTFNPVWGCAKVSPGCTNCYAEAWAKRTGHKVWGEGGQRRTFGEKHWAEPLKWNAKAKKSGTRARVFCASMSDVFEDHLVWKTERPRLFRLIDATPHLDWLLLTKRPENIARMIPVPDEAAQPWPNVWLGTTVEDQQRANERIPHLVAVPAVVRFLSCEPLLGPLNLDQWLDEDHNGFVHLVDWVIVGGESGGKARPLDLAWARSLVEQCRVAGVAPFVKQLGARPFEVANVSDLTPRAAAGDIETMMRRPPSAAQRDGWTRVTIAKTGESAHYRYHRLKDSHGGDMAEWPEDLRVREFPEVSHA